METEIEMNRRLIDNSLWVMNDVRNNIYWRALKSSEQANQILFDFNLPNLRFIEHINLPFDLFPKFKGKKMGYLYNVNGGFNSIDLYFGNETRFDSPHKKKHFVLGDEENAQLYENIELTTNLIGAINEIRKLFYQRGFEKKDSERYRSAKNNCKRIQFLNNDGSFDRNKPIKELFNLDIPDEPNYKFKFNKRFTYSKKSKSKIVGHITLKKKHIIKFNRIHNPNLEVTYQIVDSNYKIDTHLSILIDSVCKILWFRYGYGD